MLTSRSSFLFGFIVTHGDLLCFDCSLVVSEPQLLVLCGPTGTCSKVLVAKRIFFCCMILFLTVSVSLTFLIPISPTYRYIMQEVLFSTLFNVVASLYFIFLLSFRENQ